MPRNLYRDLARVILGEPLDAGAAIDPEPQAGVCPECGGDLEACDGETYCPDCLTFGLSR